MLAGTICAQLIVFDEPTTALDVTTGRRAGRNQGRVEGGAGAGIMSRNDLAVVAQVADG
jgi:ABC-type glutathione transport system ATPase component